MLNKNNIILHLKSIHNYLTPSGKFCGFIRTETNNIPVAEEAFAIINSQINQAIHHKTEQIINLQSTRLTDDQLKEIIWSNGYDIIYYKNEFYETVIDNTDEYKKALISAAIHNIRHHTLALVE